MTEPADLTHALFLALREVEAALEALHSADGFLPVQVKRLQDARVVAQDALRRYQAQTALR